VLGEAFHLAETYGMRLPQVHPPCQPAGKLRHFPQSPPEPVRRSTAVFAGPLFSFGDSRVWIGRLAHASKTRSALPRPFIDAQPPLWPDRDRVVVAAILCVIGVGPALPPPILADWQCRAPVCPVSSIALLLESQLPTMRRRAPAARRRVAQHHLESRIRATQPAATVHDQCPRR
jgi:hypothetical protein